MIEIRALGDFAVLVDGVPRSLSSDKQAALLVYLACNPERTLRREQLAALLWEGVDHKRRHSLSQAMHQLRRALPELPLQVDREGIRLRREDVDVDVYRFRSAALAQRYEDAIACYAGDFLDGVWVDGAREFERWQQEQRDELSWLARRVLERLLRRAEGEGDWGKVEGWASRLLRFDPLDEAVHRLHIQAIAIHEGRRAALGEYRRVVRLLQEELGRGPEPATQLLASGLEHDGADSGGIADFDDEERHWTPFVGRAEEYRAFRDVWERVRRGSGRALVISGEPGIGKTRLCEHLLRVCAVQGARIFQGRCYPTDNHIPYSAIADCVLDNLRDRDLATLPSEWSTVLAEVLPELRGRLSEVVKIATLDQEGARRRLFEAFARLLQGVARGSPVVFFLDDYQWADKSTAALLSYLARRLADSPFLLLVSTRGEAGAPGLPVEPVPTGDRTVRLFQEIALEPLSLVETEQLIELFGERQAVRYSEAVRAEIIARVGGRPFFVLELLKATGEHSRDRGEQESGDEFRRGNSIPLPASVEEFLGALLRTVGEEAERLIAALAVLGKGADPKLVGKVAGLDVAGVMRGLKELTTRKLVEEAEGSVSFPHDLIREAAYRSLGCARRCLLHGAAGAALRSLGGTPAAVLCTHYELAGQREETFHYALRAADESESVYAHQETEYFLRTALAHAGDHMQRLDLKERLGRLLLSLRRYPEAERYLLEARTDPAVVSDPRRLLAIDTLVLSIRAKLMVLAPDALLAKAQELAEVALACGDLARLVVIYRLMSEVAHNTGECGIVLEKIEQLTRLADVTDDIEARVLALTIAANGIGLYQGVQVALTYAERAVEQAERDGGRQSIILALASRARNRLQAGELDLAEQDFTAILALMERLAIPFQRQAALNDYGVLLMERGDYTAARRVLAEALEMAWDAGAVAEQAIACGNIVLLEHEAGERKTAIEKAEHVLTHFQPSVTWMPMAGVRAILGLYAIDRNDYHEAHRYRREILLDYTGEDRWVTDIAHIEIFLARIAELEGGAEQALARLERAIASYRGRDVFCRSRLELERARLLMERDPRAAAEQARAVRKLGEESGARPLVEKADAILAQVGTF